MASRERGYNRRVTTIDPGMTVPGLRGRWQIDRRLGSGGFGTTFLARGEDGRAVVLKQLRLDRMDDWKALDLFEREARALAALEHPRIPRLHDFFAFDGAAALAASDLAMHPRPASLVLVQGYVEGRSLRAAIDAGARFDAAAVERMLRALLDILAYLHGLHPPIVHRDIKPENIVLDAEGAPHLVDFGAIQGRLLAQGQAGSTSVGTFGYVPLEQIMGQARPASDLYALAMTLLVAVTHGAPDSLPIDADTSKVDVRAASPHLPAHVARALDAMLEPAVGQRVATAEAARDLLDGRGQAPARAPGPAPEPPPDPLRWVWRVSMGAGLLGAGVLYGPLFNELSERELMEISPLWVAAVAFGLTGKLSKRTLGAWSRLGIAAVGLVAALLGLSMFLVGIFPLL